MLRAMAALVAARSGFAARRAASSGDVGLAGRAPLVVVASRACAPPSPAAQNRAAHRAFSSLPPQRARVACAAHVARARAIPRRHGAGTHARAAASRGGGAPRAPRGAAAIAAVRARLCARRFVALAARSGDDSAPVAAAAAAGDDDAAASGSAASGSPHAKPPPPHTAAASSYVPQAPNYAGAGATIPENDAELEPGHCVLIDGMSLVFRSFYGWRNRAGDPLLNAAGDDVSVLYSVAHAILAMLELAPTHLAVCFDAKGKTFRHEMFADYKANRPPTPPEIAEVIPRCVKMVEDMGVPCLSESGVEADDVIGTIARRAVEAGLHVSIVSPDKDFFQLLGPRVRQLRPNGKNYTETGGGDKDGGASEGRGDDANARTTKQTEYYGFGDPTHRNVTGRGLVPYTEADFRAEHSDLDPAQFVDLLAMVGDSSDNVPGVEGIGPKTAPRLLVEYGDIEGAVANAADIKNKRAREGLGSERGAATALLCRSLVKIRTELNVPTLNPPALELRDIQLSNGRVPPPDGGKWVGEHLERTLELPNAGERWREICYRAKLEAEERKKNRVA